MKKTQKKKVKTQAPLDAPLDERTWRRWNWAQSMAGLAAIDVVVSFLRHQTDAELDPLTITPDQRKQFVTETLLEAARVSLEMYP